MSSKSLLISLFFFSSTLLSLGQIQELMVQRGYSGQLSITEAINGSVLIVYDGNEYFDVVDSESGRQLYRIDKGLGPVLKVVDVAGTQDILVFYESYLMIWSLDEKKERYLSVELEKTRSSERRHFLRCSKEVGCERFQYDDVLLLVSEYGELLIVDLNLAKTIFYKRTGICYLNIYKTAECLVQVLGLNGVIYEWDFENLEMISISNCANEYRAKDQIYLYKGRMINDFGFESFVFRNSLMNRLLFFSQTGELTNRYDFEGINWTRSYQPYQFRYFILENLGLYIESVGDSTLIVSRNNEKIDLEIKEFGTIAVKGYISNSDTLLYLMSTNQKKYTRFSTKMLVLKKLNNSWLVIGNQQIPESYDLCISKNQDSIFLLGYGNISKLSSNTLKHSKFIERGEGLISDLCIFPNGKYLISFLNQKRSRRNTLLEIEDQKMTVKGNFNSSFYFNKFSNLVSLSFSQSQKRSRYLLFYSPDRNRIIDDTLILGVNDFFFQSRIDSSILLSKVEILDYSNPSKRFQFSITNNNKSIKYSQEKTYLYDEMTRFVWNKGGEMFYLNPDWIILNGKERSLKWDVYFKKHNDKFERTKIRCAIQNREAIGFTDIENKICSDCFYYLSIKKELCYVDFFGKVIKKPFNVNGFEGMKISPSGRKMVVQRNHEYFLVNESDTIRINHSLPLGCKIYFDSAEKHIVFTKNNGFVLYSIDRNKALYSYLILDSLNWLAYDDDYHYDGTPAAREQLYFTCGLEIIELSQLKDALYVPGLVEKIMSGQPILYPKLSELEICGTLPLIEKLEDAPYHYTITPRKLGLKRVELYVNGKRVMMKSKEELKKKDEHYEWNIEEKEIQKFFVPGEENQVKVIGIVQQGNNEMQSRGVVEEVESTEEEKQHPTFYGLMVGVSDYKDDRLDLKYPTKDSKDLGKVMEAAAKKLLNTSTENHVKMYYVNSEVKGENGYATPEREGVRRALEAISKEARAEDVVMIFFAGHGVMEGDKDKRFTFLTAESTKENLVGISTKDLEEWMSGEKGYLPNKTILIFDACNSGQATEELMAMARDDDETQRIRQVEDLKDKSGMFIMSASAANQSAYELPRYGHGLLTYSLLKTLKTSSSTLDEEKFINVQKWFLETETTMDNMTRELGIEQEAQPFGRGNIRVGELDEEIRGGIEIQQEKPMVYCANALNMETTEDDLHFKEFMNQGFSRSVEDPLHFIWGNHQQHDVEVNIIYQPVKEGYEVKVKWKRKGQTLDSMSFMDGDLQKIKEKILLETERVVLQ